MSGKTSQSFNGTTENLRGNEIVTVKFLTDANETLTQAFNLNTDIGALKSHLHRTLNTDQNLIIIEREEVGGEVSHRPSDEQTLKELGATSLGIFELHLRGDGVRLPKPPAYYLPAVDVITVDVNRKQLVVEIERCGPVDGHKRWLGGYRDKRTGKTYHHATSQTDPKAFISAPCVVHRTDGRTQTCIDKAVGRPTSRSTWTQTNRGDYCSGNVEYTDGRWVKPRRYQSYQSWLQEDRVLSSVLKIQRAFRRILAARERRRVAAAAEADKDEEQRRLLRQRQSRSMTSGPDSGIAVTTSTLESKQQHFYSLYTMIGKWWKKERQRIKEIEAEKSRKAAQMNLLKKEIKFLLEMEKQRSDLKYELTKHDDVTFLNKTSKPKMFKNRAGKLLTVDTVGNQKARALKELYAKIVIPREGVDRAEALDELHAAVSESCYKYKEHLLAAVAVEKGLVNMGADAASLRSARSRVEQMFRHYIRQPDVNPEADSYYRPTEKRLLNVYTCIRCKRNLAATDFSLESRVNRTNVCASCEWTEQVGHKRIDMAPYRRMLKALRHDEMQMAAYGSECFLMQPTEVYRLVSIVWREKSAVSESGQLNSLRLVRWRRHEPWSPWNCVLLTRSEAEVHCRLDGDPADCYDEQFVRSVTNKHLMARLQFSNLVQAVDHRTADRAKPLSKHWKTVADRFNIKTSK
ncbi:IQ and ubiquitin-like domain-containing protein [Melanaphis sacchari]|uniref:IQ and ubiquitin-like domain-containing protein n=1 Tax=Melanaphis sacchari TaxID=742174 RepID=UPI000DC14041|nr:IQ and ubiquitin-like domain-containing protein [Melanaphis sacchari]